MASVRSAAARTRAWPSWARYAGATILALTAFCFQRLLKGEIPPHLFLLYFPAIFVAAAMFGRAAAAWSVALSAALSGYFLFEPPGFAIGDPVDALALVLYIATGLLLVCILADAYREIDLLTGEAVARREALAHAEAADRRKEILLREMAHRVHNDLQFLSSMLQIEGRALEPGPARAALLAAGSRISVVGRVHSLLQREGPAHVDMKPLIEELCADLSDSLVALRPIALRVDIESGLLPLDAARSTALIVNELVTNAVKYAFPEDRPGTVNIRSTREKDDILLLVTDDGIGALAEAAPQGSGYGRKLVRALAQQLGGSIAITTEQTGTRCELRFPAPRR